MFKVTRTYKNTDEDTLRIDTIFMVQSVSGLIERPQNFTYIRKVSTQNLLEPSDRTVASISILSTADDWEDSSGDYTWVKWTDRSIVCQMTDLPGVGDEV